MAAGSCHQDHVSTLLHVVHAMFEAAVVKCVVADALQHITNAQGSSFLRFHDIYMHCRDTVDLFNFFRDVLGGGAWDFWSWVSQRCRAWFIAVNHAFGRPCIVELLCFCVTVSSLSLSRWSCDENVSIFFGGYFLSDAALVKYVMPDSLPPPTSHWNEPAFMRLCICYVSFYLSTHEVALWWPYVQNNGGGACAFRCPTSQIRRAWFIAVKYTVTGPHIHEILTRTCRDLHTYMSLLTHKSHTHTPVSAVVVRRRVCGVPAWTWIRTWIRNLCVKPYS